MSVETRGWGTYSPGTWKRAFSNQTTHKSCVPTTHDHGLRVAGTPTWLRVHQGGRRPGWSPGSRRPVRQKTIPRCRSNSTMPRNRCQGNELQRQLCWLDRQPYPSYPPTSETGSKIFWSKCFKFNSLNKYYGVTMPGTVQDTRSFKKKKNTHTLDLLIKK